MGLTQTWRAPWRGWVLGVVRAGVVVASCSWGALGAWAETPQRNLLVEWRLSASSERQGQGARLRRGEFTVDSRGGVQGQGSAEVTSTTRSHRETGLQQLQVLNGGKARIYLGSSRPVTQWQFGVSGDGRTNLAGLGGNGGAADGASVGAGAAGAGGQASAPSGPRWQVWSSTTLVDTGRGISVRPRWGGGRTVTVELEARLAQQATDAPDGQTEVTEVMTTLQLPMGAWTEVARRGGQWQQSRRGTLSTEDIGGDDNEVLEMRVSLPDR